MYDGFKITPPFFEIGPKVYLYGEKVVELAIFADSLIEKYDVDIIFTAQYTDIYTVRKNTKRLKVFAQHMDVVEPGRGVGAVLPEALKDAGAMGVLLNHAEKPMTLEMLHRAIGRAEDVGLASLVCAGDAAESAAIACLSPNIVLAESPLLICGRRSASDQKEIEIINNAVRKISPAIHVLHGAGIKDERDVFEVIMAGADATGSTSGILCSDNPLEMMEKMILSVRRAWDIRKRTV